MLTGRDPAARAAGPAGVRSGPLGRGGEAVDRLRQRQGRGALPRARRAGETVRLRQPPARPGAPEQQQPPGLARRSHRKASSFQSDRRRIPGAASVGSSRASTRRRISAAEFQETLDGVGARSRAPALLRARAPEALPHPRMKGQAPRPPADPAGARDGASRFFTRSSPTNRLQVEAKKRQVRLDTACGRRVQAPDELQIEPAPVALVMPRWSL